MYGAINIDHIDSKIRKSGENTEPKEKMDYASSEAADFEHAIRATGFGKFNVLLILAILPTAFAQVFESTSMSFVLPIAQCDLDLSLGDKGTLNAITFAGMISSGFIWGFICDTAGRKKVMIIGYLLDAFFSLLASSSQNFFMLLIAKFFGGFIINGPFSAATSYLTEFHSSQHRTRVQLVRGIIVSLGNITMPLLAWAVLPRNLNITILDILDIHSWNIYLFICSLAPLASGVIFVFMPESPKFLMTTGRNQEALKVFQKIYRINTGKPVYTYPIKKIVNETILSENDENAKQKTGKAIIEGLHKIKPLFCQPLLLQLIHVCVNSFCLLMSTNTLKLWLPQLFQTINDYEFMHNGTSSSMCEMLNTNLIGSNSSAGKCTVNLDNSSVYIKSIIVGVTSILCFFLTGTIINLLGKKKVIIVMTTIAGISASCIYFSPNSEAVLALSTVFLALSGVCINILLTITLEIFPTNLRAMAISLHLMSSRVGSIVGNLVFPYLLYAGCAPPFLYIGLLSFSCGLLSLLYPNTENKPLV